MEIKKRKLKNKKLLLIILLAGVLIGGIVVIGSWAQKSVIDSFSNTDKIATSSNLYLQTGSGIIKLGKSSASATTCTTNEECSSGFCVDGYCCDTACSGSACQTCGEYSNGGAGTCGYVNSASEDPGNECPGVLGDCASLTCNGTGYACGYLSAGEQGQATCKRCNGSSYASVNITDNTEDTEGTNKCEGQCAVCQSGSCSWATASTDPDNDCAVGSTCSDGCNSGLCAGGSSACQILSSGDGYCPVCGKCTDSDAACENIQYPTGDYIEPTCVGIYSCAGCNMCFYDP